MDLILEIDTKKVNQGVPIQWNTIKAICCSQVSTHTIRMKEMSGSAISIQTVAYETSSNLYIN